MAVVAIIGFNINLLKFNSNFIVFLNTIKLKKNAKKLFITDAIAAPFTPNFGFGTKIKLNINKRASLTREVSYLFTGELSISFIYNITLFFSKKFSINLVNRYSFFKSLLHTTNKFEINLKDICDNLIVIELFKINSKFCKIFSYFWKSLWPLKKIGINTVESYLDLTVEVKFLSNENDLKLSGNPGYIKGNPLFFGERENEDNDQITDDYIYSKGLIFPIEKGEFSPNNNEDGSFYFYYNNYMDNRITFEDLTIFGYKNDFRTIVNQIFGNNGNNRNNNKLKLAKFGNAKDFNIELNNVDIKDKENFVLLVQYKDSGAVNNTQNQIYKCDKYDINSKNGEFNSYFYFIIKFLKMETETEWYYARGPVIIKLPRNLMYPFKIGTSKYNRWIYILFLLININ